MVYGTQITIVSRVYKPTNITGGPHIVSPDITMNYWLWSLQYHISGIFTNINHIYTHDNFQSPYIPVSPGFLLPFSWSSFLALDVDGGPKRRSRRGESDALLRLRRARRGGRRVKIEIWPETARNFNVEKPLFKAIFWVQQLLFRPEYQKKENPTNERTKTVFDRQKTMGESQGNLGRVLRKVPFWEKDHGGDFVEESLAVFFWDQNG